MNYSESKLEIFASVQNDHRNMFKMIEYINETIIFSQSLLSSFEWIYQRSN